MAWNDEKPDRMGDDLELDVTGGYMKLIELYIANNDWDINTPLTLTGCINVDKMPADKATEIYGECEVLWFSENLVNLM